MTMATQHLLSLPHYLDQPILLNNLRKASPYLLPLAGATYVAVDTFRADPKEHGKTLVKGLSVTGVTIAFALWGAKLFLKPSPAGAKEVLKTLSPLMKEKGMVMSQKLRRQLAQYSNPPQLLNILQNSSKKNLPPSIKSFLQTSTLTPVKHHQLKLNVARLLIEKTSSHSPLKTQVLQLIQKAENRVLTVNEIHQLRQTVPKLAPDLEKSKQWLQLLMAQPAHVSGKEIMNEIKNLSLMGLFPILGGLLGGVMGNAINREDWRDKFKNQAKEGFFQYFANILLCNIGAGICLSLLEKNAPKMSGNRTARFAAMTLGIVSFGILGGSAIANFLGKNLINGIIDDGLVEGTQQFFEKLRADNETSLFEGLYDERKPEALDIGLHLDDMATVGVLSGLKWIEPALPFFYSISGIRTGIGYRTHKKEKPERSSEPQQSYSNKNTCPQLFQGHHVFKMLSHQQQKPFQHSHVQR